MKEFGYKLVENKSDLRGAFEVRKEVFVEQQGIAESIVFDGLDDDAMHMVVKSGERAIGTARIRFLGAREVKLERMAVLETFRNMRVGKGILSLLIEELGSKQVEKIVLPAQHDAVEFYKKCGFEQSGLPLWEAGIKHIRMERRL
jgi:predicted GNAT family N-acyltransferase